jgi:hypothetical protein
LLRSTGILRVGSNVQIITVFLEKKINTFSH